MEDRIPALFVQRNEDVIFSPTGHAVQWMYGYDGAVWITKIIRRHTDLVPAFGTKAYLAREDRIWSAMCFICLRDKRSHGIICTDCRCDVKGETALHAVRIWLVRELSVGRDVAGVIRAAYCAGLR
jgi:hypothetical protein